MIFAQLRRRPDRIVTVAAWLAYVAFAAWLLLPALLGVSVFLSTDLLTSFAPWAVSNPGPDPVVNRFVNDTVDTIAPSSALLGASLREGDIAYWNPYSAGGAALGALPDYGLYSPLSLPWLLLEPQYAPGVVKLLELIAIGAGTVLLARTWRLHSAAAPLMALAFASSGFMVAWTNWPQTRVAALLPLLLWAVEAAVTRRRARDALPLALVLASMLLGGFPAVVGYAAYMVVPYAIVRLIAQRVGPREWLRAIGVGLAAALAALILTAWQLVPFAANASEVIDFERRQQSPESHLDPLGLATSIAPDVFGSVGQGDWGPLHPVERFVFVGAAMLALAAVGVAFANRNRRARGVVGFTTVALVVALVLTYEGGPLLAAAQHLPVFSNNPIGRLRSIIGLLVTILVGFGVDRLVRGVLTSTTASPRRQIARGAAAGILLLGAAGLLAWIVRNAMFRAPAPVVPQMRESTIVALVIAGVVVLVMIAAIVWRRRPAARFGAVVLIAAIASTQAIAVVSQWWPRSDPETFYPTTAAHEFLEEHLGDERVASVGLTFYPGTSSYYEIRQATGHSFHAPEWRDMLVAADPEVMASPTFSTLSVESMGSPVLDRLSVRYVGVDPTLPIPGTTVSLESSGTRISTEGLEGSGPLRGFVLDVEGGTGDDSIARGTLRVTVGDAITEVPIEQRTDRPGERYVAVPLLNALPNDTVWEASLTIAEGDTLELGTEGFANAIVRPVDDGLSIVHAGDATIYERANVLDRFRWSDTAVTVSSPEERVALLNSADLPPETVVLSEGPVPAMTAGSTADITVVADDGDRIVLDVDADASGMLTVADPLQLAGWTATVDGRPVELRAADHAVVALAVDTGTHRVELQYDPPGLATGATVTLGGLAVAVVVLVANLVIVRIRRRAVRAFEPAQSTSD